MKKKFKRFLSLIVVCMMMVSTMAISAGAEALQTTGLDPAKTEGSLTLKETIDGKASTYTAYQVLKAEYVEGQDMYEYVLTDNFTGIEGVSVEAIAGAKGGSPNHIINGELDAIAAKLENHVNTEEVEGIQITAESKTNLPIGYYLILETTVSEGFKQTKPMLVAIPDRTGSEGKYNYDIVVTIKDQPITTTKTIEESTAALQDSIAQQVGEEFTFKIVQDVPKYDDTYKNVVFKVTDTMSAGLDFVADSVKVKTKQGETEKDLTAGSYGFLQSEDGKTLTFDFSKNNGEADEDYYASVKNADQVIITYKATLNKDAKFGPTGNTNEVYPIFGEDPNSTTNGKKDVTVNYAGGLQITKKGEDSALLEGAKFTVYTDETCTIEAPLVTYKVTTDENGTTITEEKNDTLSATATTDKNGIVKFEGLGAGTYYIKEVEAPGGYIKLKNPIKVDVEVTLPESITTGEETATFKYTISGDGIDGEKVIETNDGIAEFNVQNVKGFTLPTTGGMGTYIFTIGGVILIAAAVVLLIRLRKKAN